MTDSSKLAGRLAPIIRRGIIVAAADSCALFSVAPREADSLIWSAELTKESDPDLLAAEAASAAVEESEAGGSTRFRLDALHEGQAVATLVFRTAADKRASADPVGDALLPGKGESAEHSILRQMMRHSEAAHRLALGAVERREENFYKELARVQARNAELEARVFDDARKHLEHLREERMADVLLLEVDAKTRAMNEGIDLVKKFGPRLVARLTGADKLSPVAEVLRGLTAEQLTALESTGLVTPEQVKALREAWQLLQESKPAPRALPANGGKPAKA